MRSMPVGQKQGARQTLAPEGTDPVYARWSVPSWCGRSGAPMVRVGQPVRGTLRRCLRRSVVMQTKSRNARQDQTGNVTQMALVITCVFDACAAPDIMTTHAVGTLPSTSPVFDG